MVGGSDERRRRRGGGAEVGWRRCGGSVEAGWRCVSCVGPVCVGVWLSVAADFAECQ